MDCKDQLQVAIVGSGMAGLVTAYLLHRDAEQRYAVTVFEEGRELSLGAASLSLPSLSEGCIDQVDLPMRAFAGGFYNNLRALYDHLGVPYRSQPFLFAFSRVFSYNGGAMETNTHFIHSSNNHRIPPLKPRGVTTAAHVLETLYLLLCYGWFSICCFLVMPLSSSPGMVCETLEQYVTRIRLPKYFVSHYLLPLISSVTTCPHRDLLDFPAYDVIEYKKKTHGAWHYVLCNGIRDVQTRLVNGIEIRFSARVLAVETQPSGIKLRWNRLEHCQSLSPVVEYYDRVILAVSPDVVGKIFAPLRREMAQIPTLKVESIVHTNDKEASFASRLCPADEGRGKTEVIHLRTSMNGCTESSHIQSSGAVIVTCPFTAIHPQNIIQSSKFTRVLRTPESRRIINAIFNGQHTDQLFRSEKNQSVWRNGHGSVWLVGGWCWDGMVLLEGCIVSAIRVADAFKAEVPWRKRE